jgi:hypothetical protein
MWHLSYKEIQELLREIEEEYIHEIKSSSDHDDKKYNTTAVYVTRNIRNKLYNAMKKKYE